MMSQDDTKFADEYLNELARLLPLLDRKAIAHGIGMLRAVQRADRTIYICGNGGSASIASQMVVDIVKGASFRKAARFKMIGLTDSMATLSAYANDEGYETVFVEPLRNFATAGDVLIAISGSGNSPNVLRAVEYAASIGCHTLGITSGESGALRNAVECCLPVPTRHMGRLEDCFFVLTHVLCYALMEAG